MYKSCGPCDSKFQQQYVHNGLILDMKKPLVLQGTVVYYRNCIIEIFDQFHDARRYSSHFCRIFEAETSKHREIHTEVLQGSILFPTLHAHTHKHIYMRQEPRVFIQPSLLMIFVYTSMPQISKWTFSQKTAARTHFNKVMV
jgi:hypothetical protein